ncbi:MAG TPA: IPT/TIG domain-containing protein [Pyrinomonadaceae bacterium]
MFEGKTTAERNKTIAAIALGAIALFFVVRMFLGTSSTPTTNTNTRRTNANANTAARGAATNAPPNLSAAATPDPSLVAPQPIEFRSVTPDVPAAGRNIFAFYVAPTPAPKASATVNVPLPTPEPTPPLLVNGLTPANVFARTGEFALQVNGDKFTPQSRIYFDGQELPTRFVSPQQLATNVPATFNSSPGSHQIIVRTPDGQLFSNSATLNVTAPPAPTYTYVGVLIRPRGNDTAMLKDSKGELVSVQRGDLVGGRFRVTNISQRDIELTDQQLKIKHSLPYSDPRNPSARQPGAPPSQRPPSPPPAKSEDDEENEP